LAFYRLADFIRGLCYSFEVVNFEALIGECLSTTGLFAPQRKAGAKPRSWMQGEWTKVKGKWPLINKVEAVN
jgi:hypothetical protein